MAKYKLLIEANQYSYKTVDAPELIGGNGTQEIKNKLAYSIPIGTIIEAEPSKFNGGDNDDFPNSFQVSLKKDTDKYPIFLSNVRDVKNNKYYSKDLELVPNDAKITLDEDIKVLKSNNSALSTDVSGETFFQKNKTTLMFFGALAVGYLVYKKLK